MGGGEGLCRVGEERPMAEGGGRGPIHGHSMVDRLTGRKRRRERRRRQRDCRRGWVRPMEKREENSRRGESERS